MKRSILLGIMLSAAIGASAQYSNIANGLTNVLMPALSGSSSYKGFVDAAYTQGVGRYRSNFATISTSQGYQLNSWLFMGAGIGVDLMWSYVNDDWGNGWSQSNMDRYDDTYVSKAVMIPVFTDFRFNIGPRNAASFFIDLKIGASFLANSNSVKIRNGYLTNTSYFYFQPAIGVRIPVNSQNAKQAFNIGVHYRLLTSDYWSGYQSSIVQNGLGAHVGFEW